MSELILSFLIGVTANLLFDSAYYAIRLIKHRSRLSDGKKKSLIVKGLPSEPSPEAEQIALKVIDGIERAEGVTLREMSDEVAESYINEIADIVIQRTMKDLQYDKKRGQKLLEELRSLEPGSVK